MSLYLKFEPHSFYKEFAIYDNRNFRLRGKVEGTLSPHKWHAYTDNGNTYRIDELASYSLKDLKKLITEYRSR